MSLDFEWSGRKEQEGILPLNNVECLLFFSLPQIVSSELLIFALKLALTLAYFTAEPSRHVSPIV